MIDVVIEGDEFGVNSAITRIREIVGEKVSSGAAYFGSGPALHGTKREPRLSLPLPVSLMSRANSTHSSKARTVRRLKSSK